MHLIRTFTQSEDGVSASEYGLLLALIGVVAITSVSLLGDAVDQTFDTIEDFVAGGNQGGIDDDS